MSVTTHREPVCTQPDGEPSLELEIDARQRDLGDGFMVRRLLPSVARRMVGPFIFFDQMGPAQLEVGKGLDVRPHPHIHLSTVTYLFRGDILHRDSLGTEQLITPGAVNWMTAGRGIVHSERSPSAARAAGVAVHGLQLWVALPTAHEETAPSFQHVPARDLPELERPGARLKLIAGEAFGARAPVEVHSPLFYIDAELEGGATLEVPAEHEQRAVYVVSGAVSLDGKPHGTGAMLVLRPHVAARLTALEPARVMLLGGAPLDGERFMFWNFVSSSREKLEAAKLAWKERRFPTVPGDDVEFIPLPE
jgi:redox-sensitive bicupin YhaK (pirin superfamily)